MKLFLTFLPILILSVPAFADGFGANDKVLYFNSGVLIDVIKNTFPENLQLNVAQKYIDLMDKNGNVSIQDLMAVCHAGKLDVTKCRDFIQDLLNTTNTDIKPFYWADYISTGFDGDLNIYNSGDGYFHDNANLGDGEWAIQFGWVKGNSFKKLYPDTKYIIGTSACTNIAGTKYMAENTKNFAQNEQTGNHCWCRMSGPEQSAWVYYGPRGGDNNPKCERQCALGCMSGLRDDTEMRRAMFTTIKLNSSNANMVADGSLAKNLDNEFKPCEFDWANDTKIQWATEVKWNEVKTKSNSYSYDGTDLDYEQWGIGDFEWMKQDNFQCKYPGITRIKGVATCNNENGAVGHTTNKNFKSNQKNGSNCWCKIIYPEQSKWVYVYNYFEGIRTTEIPVTSKKVNSRTNEIVEEKHFTEKLEPTTEEGVVACNTNCIYRCGYISNDESVKNLKLLFESIGKK